MFLIVVFLIKKSVYLHECVARVEIIENKMTRKINLILHELEVYVKRFIV